MKRANKRIKLSQHFRHIAKHYDRYRSLDEEPVRFIVESVPRDEQIICEIGCGTGRYLMALVRAFERAGVAVKGAHGVDVSTDMLDLGKLNGMQFPTPIRWTLARSDETGLPPGTISLVTSFNSFHHFPVDETLAEVRRILRPEGYFAIYVRVRDQESEHLWGRWFPGFLDHSVAPTRDLMAGLSRHNRSFELVCEQEFHYTRRASLSWICEQTENRHYSTLRDYDDAEFKSAYRKFVENLRKHYKDPDDITYESKCSLFLHQVVNAPR